VLAKTAGLGLAAVGPIGTTPGRSADPEGVEVNDIQSQLNATRVRRVITPNSLDALQAAIRDAGRDGHAVSVAGGRHAMGGQQFGRGTVLLDTTGLNRIVSFDQDRGRIEVEAGIQWPELVEYLHREQTGRPKPWGIRQKQTGVDRVCLGGSLAANVHGRGLSFPPIVGDVESFVLIDANGKAHTCSRRENPELFALAIGGYGLFGVIAQVTLRLVPRTKLRREVQVIPIKELPALFEKRVRDGFVYGDCQYSTDLTGEAEAHQGVLSCYRPVADDVPIPENQRQLSEKEWAEFYRLARTDKKRAFEKYSEYYLSTSGQVYWSDRSQLAGNFAGHRAAVDAARGTEAITEVYVSKDALLPFLARVRADYLEHKVDMTYGTIRLIEKDAETFLPWAREALVCVVCNLHVMHTEAGNQKAADDFRRIIDRAIEFKGSFFLTYHRWATAKQIETCYPRFVEFLRLKKKYDSQERFQSDWYRHYATLFMDKL
jgi:FAD/FMN-containing dehydrogenase